MNNREIFIILPCFNEEKRIQKTLDELDANNFKNLLVINDGSTDKTINIIQDFKNKKNTNIIILDLKKNFGLSQAKLIGFAFLYNEFKKSNSLENYSILKMDSDGQHRISDVIDIINYYQKNDYAFIQSNRNFSKYPLFKKFGNKVFSIFISILTFKKIIDPMSGIKIFDLEFVENILKFYNGYKYSGAMEISLIANYSKNFKANFQIDIEYYRGGGAKFFDGFHVLFSTLITFLRIKFNLKFNTQNRLGKLLKNKDVQVK